MPTRARSLLRLLACGALAAGLVACGGGGSAASDSDTSTGAGTGGTGGTTTASVTGNITLSWTAPQTRADGTPLTDLAGYRIYYGTTSGLYTQSVTISSASTTTYTLANLAAGTYYLTMKSFDTSNIESAGTAEASKTIN